MASKRRAGIAQLVEQRTENPRVTSSNLVPGIIYNGISRCLPTRSHMILSQGLVKEILRPLSNLRQPVHRGDLYDASLIQKRVGGVAR